MLVFAPIYGWWILGLFALSAVKQLTLDARTARSSPRPRRRRAPRLAYELRKQLRSFELIYAASDEALYAAKAAGRNRVLAAAA